jgi:single-strand DNA-binding protein
MAGVGFLLFKIRDKPCKRRIFSPHPDRETFCSLPTGQTSVSLLRENQQGGSMASLNRVELIGNLGRDPEIRYTPGGTAVASFSLATSEKVKNKSGEWEIRTEWHNIVLYARLAEVAGEYLSKGKSVYLDGKLKTRKWQDRDGKDRYTTEIIGDKLLMLGSKHGSIPDGSDDQPSNSQAHEDIPHDDTDPF